MMAFFGVLLLFCPPAECPSSRLHAPTEFEPAQARSIAVILSCPIPGEPTPTPDSDRDLVADEIESSDDDDAPAQALFTGSNPGPSSGDARLHPSPIIPASPPLRTFSTRLRC